LNRCWAPHVPGEPLMTPAAFKRAIRDLQVWCSSCMVAFSGSDPIGVLIGAKRASATLIHTIAVHPDHLRQGHSRHLLASLGSKLAILGPPRLVAEVPDTLIPACELFRVSGYVEEAQLTDYVWDARGSGGNPLGTDQLGRDYLARLIYGGRISLLIGFATVVISGVIGTALGIAAGYWGGRIDLIINFFLTIRLTLPVVLVALVVVALVGNSLNVLMLVIGLLLWDRFAIVTRSATLQLANLEFIVKFEQTEIPSGDIRYDSG